MNYEEAVRYLESTAARGSKLGLERVQELAKRLGEPQKQYRVIHIAGTNGKGSVGAMLASILTQAGYRTGHFSSPALTSPLDYFRLQTQEITEMQFAAVMTEVQAQAETMPDPPTQFEILAAAAYTLFARQRCDVAVIECCMGGDLDCTNIIDHPVLSIITNVKLDHMGFLGNTTAEIAAHKAGIIKHGCPVLLGAGTTDAAACAVIRERARMLDAPFCDAGAMTGTAGEMTLEGTVFRFDGQTYRIALPGTYQTLNAATVLHAVRILRMQGMTFPESAVHAGLETVRWHGRFEVLRKQPLILFDGAHNPDGMEQLHEGLTRYFGKKRCIAVIGVMADKDYSRYAQMLAPHVKCVYAVQPDNPRALAADALAEVFASAGIEAVPCRSVAEGVKNAYFCAESEHLPVIGIGSLYLYRAFCGALQEIL